MWIKKNSATHLYHTIHVQWCKWYLILKGSGWSDGFLYISKYPWVIHINHVPYIIHLLQTASAVKNAGPKLRFHLHLWSGFYLQIMCRRHLVSWSVAFDLRRSENLISGALVKRDRHQKACHGISVYPWHKELSVCRPCCRSPQDKELCRFEDFISLEGIICGYRAELNR